MNPTLMKNNKPNLKNADCAKFFCSGGDVDFAIMCQQVIPKFQMEKADFMELHNILRSNSPLLLIVHS